MLGGAKVVTSVEGPFTWAQLLRAIAMTMPDGSSVRFTMPTGEHVGPFLAAKGTKVGLDIVLPNTIDVLSALAALTEQYPAERVCAHLFVEHQNECLIQVWDSDFGLDTLLLTEALSPVLRAQLAAELGAGGLGLRRDA